MRKRYLTLLALSMAWPACSLAQGTLPGAERGAVEGGAAAGPVGAVVGAGVGAAAGTVGGVLGVPAGGCTSTTVRRENDMGDRETVRRTDC